MHIILHLESCCNSENLFHLLCIISLLCLIPSLLILGGRGMLQNFLKVREYSKKKLTMSSKYSRSYHILPHTFFLFLFSWSPTSPCAKQDVVAWYTEQASAVTSWDSPRSSSGELGNGISYCWLETWWKATRWSRQHVFYSAATRTNEGCEDSRAVSRNTCEVDHVSDLFEHTSLTLRNKSL